MVIHIPFAIAQVSQDHNCPVYLNKYVQMRFKSEEFKLWWGGHLKRFFKVNPLHGHECMVDRVHEAMMGMLTGERMFVPPRQ